MPQTREIRRGPSPEKVAALGSAREKVVGFLKGTASSGDVKGFLGNFGLLVRDRRELGSEGSRAVEELAGSLRKNDKQFIEAKLAPRLTEMVTAHTEELSACLREGRLDEALQLSETTEIDRAAAQALGLDNRAHREIRDGLKHQQSFLDKARKAQKELTQASLDPDSLSRRRFLRNALRVGGAVAGAATLGWTGATLGAVKQSVDDAGSVPVRAPSPPSRPKVPGIPAQPETVPSPTGEPSPSPSTSTIERQPQTISSPSPSPTKETSPSPVPSPTAERKAESSPTRVEDAAEKTIGNKDFIEFFLGNFIRDFQGKGVTLWNELPEYRDRVAEKYASSENITFAYLGIDDTRQRPKEFNGAGWGRADVIMIISFNPRTLQTTMISIPRDILSPEVLQTGVLGDKINAGTMTDYLKARSPGRNQGLADSKPLMATILETATGLRIDGLIQTNIDFMQGYVNYFDNDGNEIPGKDGIFNRLFPDGLRIVPKRDLVDTQYPGPGYSYQRVEFKKGREYFMDGWQLTQYGRMRHADSDYGRSERQREIATAAVIELLPRMIVDLSNRHTNTLDEIIRVLEEQKEVTNMFEHEIDLVYMLSEIRGSVQDILSKPNADAILARLFANSNKLIKTMVEERSMPFKSFGVTTVNMLTGYSGSTNIMKGGERHLRPNQYGNYTDYWQGLRVWVDQNVAA